MKVIVFGATGGIGKCVVKHALLKGYEVTAYVRNAKKISNKNVNVIEGSIQDYDKVYQAVAGKDAVIWCVGIPMQKNYPSMESLEGHKVLLKAMEAAGVKRLIDWGTPSVHFEKDTKSFITVVPGFMAGMSLKQAKAEIVAIGDLLKASDLDWTMVRILMPKDSVFTGNVKVGFGDRKLHFALSREDIGAFMVEQVEDLSYNRSMPIIGS